MNIEIRVRVFFDKYPTAIEAICKTFSIINYQYKHIKFVNDETYTHAIIINSYNHKIKPIPKKNVLGLAWEPPILLRRDKETIDYTQQYIGKYLIGHSLKNYPKCYVPYYGFISHIPIQPRPEKKEMMSIILSKKKYLEGHKYRHQLVQAILKTDLNIHIYGKGAINYGGDRVKGEFIREEPYKDYHFTIAIENKRYNHYISEKFTSAISLNCIPIYLGSPNIKKYFGDKCHIELTGKVIKDIKILQDIFNNKDKYLFNLDTARSNILEGNASLPEFLSKYWKV